MEVGRTGVSSVVCLERASHSNRAGLETAAYRLAYSAAVESSIEKKTRTCGCNMPCVQLHRTRGTRMDKVRLHRS